jgi:tRNA threonylcarbamoyladenosine biosynthesis protein TsaB
MPCFWKHGISFFNMLIISIDTSTRVCSVALHRNAELLACYELFTEKSHSGMLTTLIQQALQHSGHRLADVDAVAVAKGPGSYTGLRIGVSTAKGLCYALDKPLIAINTLEAMALQISAFTPKNTLLCPMIDARRMEVYCAVYDNTLAEIQATQALIIDDSAFGSLLSKYQMVFFGDGAAKCEAVLQNQPNAIFLNHLVHPSARTVGKLAATAFEQQQFEVLSSFEPYYLKDFVGTAPRPALQG